MEHFLSLWLMVSSIASNPSDLAIDLDYKAPQTCPKAEVFLSQVSNTINEETQTASVSVSVHITQTDKYTMELVHDGESRTVEDGSCQSLVEAAALIVGLWLSNRPPPKQGPIRPTGVEATTVERNRGYKFKAAFSIAQDASFDESQDLSTHLALNLGYQNDRFHFGVGVLQSRPQNRNYEVAPQIDIQAITSLAELRFGVRVNPQFEIFVIGNAGLMSVEAPKLNNAKPLSQALAYGGGGLHYSIMITDTWSLLAEVLGLTSVYAPQYTIENVGEVPLVPGFRVRGKIGTEIHF